ncbi:MAG: NUDIX hydrolase [Thermoplasmata archaeon]
MRIPETDWSLDTNEVVDMKAGREYAAVSIVVSENKLILEKRSLSQNDPWSGQFSLPGGHRSGNDITLRDTAIRETLEETGVDLRKNSRYIGHFGPFTPRNRENLEVYAYVFELPNIQKLVPSQESEYLIWVELSSLHVTNGVYGEEFNIREGTIWGMTARVLEKFIVLYEKSTK